MKFKSLWITGLLTVVIIIAGIFALPMLNSLLFNAESIIFEQQSISSSLATVSDDFMNTLIEPISEETEPLLAADIENFRIDSLSNQTEFYNNLFATVNLSYDKVVWNTLTITESEDYDILNMDTEKDENTYTVSIVLKATTTPVLFHRINKTLPSSDEVQNAIKVLEQSITKSDSLLQSYIQQIDFVLQDDDNYQLFLNRCNAQFCFDQSVPAEQVTPSLSDCCSLGTWQVYADEKEVAVVCMIEKYNLVLYYDPIEQYFCGYYFMANQSAF